MAATIANGAAWKRSIGTWISKCSWQLALGETMLRTQIRETMRKVTAAVGVAKGLLLLTSIA